MWTQLELARIFCLQKPNIGIDLILFDAEDYGQPENSKYPSLAVSLGRIQAVLPPM